MYCWFSLPDIDNIEIVSEHDEEGSGASKARRSYNYRVSYVFDLPYKIFLCNFTFWTTIVTGLCDI